MRAKTPASTGEKGVSPGADLIEESVSLAAPNGLLDARFRYAEGVDTEEAVLIFPPHPRFGGDMDNNVVAALARSAARSGRAVLTFDYHGVGASEGPCTGALDSFRYWSRIPDEDAHERCYEDAVAAVEWLGTYVSRVHAVGYSLGAQLALRVGVTYRCRIPSIVAIALAAPEDPLEFLNDLHCPALFVHSDNDFATPIGVLEKNRALVRAPTEQVLLTGTDHFFRGREDEVVAHSMEFQRRHQNAG